MKKLLLSAAVLSVVGLNAQNEPTEKKKDAVGINEEHPKATLDVNGDARIQKLEECKGCKWVLVQDEHGVVQKLPISDFSISGNSSANQIGGTASFTTLSNVEKYIPSYNFGDAGNEQGKVTSTGIDIKIPYTGATEGTVIEKEYKSKENPNLVLKIKEATISKSDGELEATIYSKGGEINLKQFTLEEVNAKNYEKVEGTFDFNVKGVTEHTTVILKALCGIPDKLYGKKTNGKLEHQFVYLPVKGPDGKWWLNNNLGAHYADVSKETNGMINITRQATSKKDHYAFGSLFQWGRFDETGHELIDWSVQNVYPKFVATPRYPNVVWEESENLKKYNDPCPTGWHTPSVSEFTTLMDAVEYDEDERNSPTIDDYWYRASGLKLPGVFPRLGKRIEKKYFANSGDAGFFWTRTSIKMGTASQFFIREYDTALPYERARNEGLAVRCIKD